MEEAFRRYVDDELDALAALRPALLANQKAQPGSRILQDNFMSVKQAAGVPNFDWDPLFFQDLPNRWTTGQVGGISVDRQDHIWIAHRPATVSPGERSAALSPAAARC